MDEDGMDRLMDELRRRAGPIVGLLPAIVAVILVVTIVVRYAWDSTLENLVCAVQDDSFYYLVPAWNAAHGGGFSLGGEITSGFQPLYELVLTAISYFCNSLETLFRTALTLNGCLYALTALVLAVTVRRMVSSLFPRLPPLAVAVSSNAAALSFLCLHTVFLSSLTGKENALAALLLAALIAGMVHEWQGRHRPLLIGALCGLLLLARITPSSLAYVAVALALLEGMRSRLIAVVACSLPVLLWGLFAREYFGHVLPMSMLVKMSSPSHFPPLHSLKVGFQYLIESLRFSLSGSSRFFIPELKARPAFRPLAQVGVMAATLVVAILGLARCLLVRGVSRPWVGLLLLDLSAVSCSVLFGAMQAGRSEEMYYTVWYVYDLPVLVAINVGFALAFLQASAGTMVRTVATTLTLGAMAYFASDVAWYGRLRPYTAADDPAFASTWQRKEIEAALWFRGHVAPENPRYRLASYSAGTLSFYLFDHVVDLDGLANNRAGETIIAGSSPREYMKSIRPDYFIDTCPGEPRDLGAERLHVLPFPQQGNYCIDRLWPAKAGGPVEALPAAVPPLR